MDQNQYHLHSFPHILAMYTCVLYIHRYNIYAILCIIIDPVSEILVDLFGLFGFLLARFKM